MKGGDNMKNFELPDLKIKEFEHETLITLSGSERGGGGERGDTEIGGGGGREEF